MKTKKKWQQPRFFLLNSNTIESGGGSGRYEQVKFVNAFGCGVAGTVVGTVTGTNQKIDICLPNCLNSTPFPISAKGTRGTTSRAFGLCS